MKLKKRLLVAMMEAWLRKEPRQNFDPLNLPVLIMDCLLFHPRAVTKAVCSYL